MDFLCSNLVKTIFTYWIGTVFNLILQLANGNYLRFSKMSNFSMALQEA